MKDLHHENQQVLHNQDACIGLVVVFRAGFQHPTTTMSDTPSLWTNAGLSKIVLLRPGMVASNPSYLGSQDRKTVVRVQQRQKHETLSEN
jgi:hypothetical protein